MNAQDHKFPDSIQGEFITLAKIQLADAEYIYNLRISESAKYLNCPAGYCIDMQKKWQESRTYNEVNYLILNHKVDEVGMVSIYDCDWINKVSNVGRLLLEDQYVHKRTPYGLEALLLTYDYVFNKMEFRKIAGTINAMNEKVYSLQKYLGMNDEGYFKKHVLLNGEPQDLYYLSLFAEEFPFYSDRILSMLEKFK